MSRRVLLRPLLGVVVAAALGVLAVTPALAYGAGENYQIGFAGTGVFPGTGVGFGFWGWCAFGGGTSFDPSTGLALSGSNGDCQVSQYFHSTSGRVDCEQSINITSWRVIGIPFFPNFSFSGTSTTHPSSATAACPLAGGAPPTFTDFAPGIPATPGHYNFNGLFGTTGEFQIQVSAIPS